jgi:dsDNA-binding SOS-regulon protein
MIEIEYIVRDQKGAERLRTTDKKAADAYDRALESAERLAELLRQDNVLPGLPEREMEDLTIYLVRNAKAVERILKGKPLDTAADALEDSQDTNANVTVLRSAG